VYAQARADHCIFLRIQDFSFEKPYGARRARVEKNPAGFYRVFQKKKQKKQI